MLVSDSRGLTIYNENVDFRVEQIGNRIRIVRLLDGRIPDGGIVLVQYRFEQSATENIITQSNYWTAGVRTNFSNNFYIYGRHLESHLTEQFPFEDFEDRTITDELGYELTWRWFTLSTRYEQHESTDFFSTNWLHRGTFRINPTFNTYLMLHAAFRSEDFKAEDIQRELYYVDSVFMYRPFSRMLISTRQYYEIESIQGIEETTFDVEAKIEYFIRRVWIGLTVDYEDQPSSLEKRLSFTIRRNF